MSNHVIRDPQTGKYAQPWFCCATSLLTRIEWVDKGAASSFQKRSEPDARAVFSKFPNAQWEVR